CRARSIRGNRQVSGGCCGLELFPRPRELPLPFPCPRCYSCAWRGNIGGMYETFDHTADLGLRIRAPALPALFAEAAPALFSVLLEDLATVQPRQELHVELAGDDREYLLFDWLKELLYHFDAEHLLLARFEVRVRDAGLTATAWGEPLD